MALATTQLKTDLQNVFDKSAKESWDTGKVADAMSKAIESFVKSGAVRNIKVNIQDGTQLADGTVE